MSHESSGSTRHNIDAFETWKQYQQVAMHFNDLLMRLRSQSLAAVAAFSAIAGVVLKAEVDASFRWGALAGVFLLLSLFWLAIWILDFCYYNRLLIGAVDALIDIERATAEGRPITELNLSTRIERVVSERRKPENGKLGRERARWLFYSIVFVALFGAFLYSIAHTGGLTLVWPAGIPPSAAQRWLAISGIGIDLVGAIVLLSAAIVTPSEAIDLGVMRLSGETDAENLTLPQVKDRLKQSTRAKWGAGLLIVGFTLQLIGALPLSG